MTGLVKPRSLRMPLYQRISLDLRGKITGGALPNGARLQSLQAFAARHRTSVFTIQRALRLLIDEGLVEARRGSGTFVAARESSIHNVGIYFCRDFLHSSGLDFYRILYLLLLEKLSGRKVNSQILVDTRGKSEQGKPPADLLKKISRGEIRSLIVGMANPQEISWMEKLGIPLAINCPEQTPYRVGMDSDQMIGLGLAELKGMGCRSIGAILPVMPNNREDMRKGIPHERQRLFRSFIDRASDLGLEVNDSWMQLPKQDLEPDQLETYGYRQFLNLWKHNKRPDGLFIYPDSIALGCLMAILQEKVSVPGELKLVVHRNAEISIPCPLPVTWVVSKVEDLALSLIERQIAGQNPEPTYVTYTVDKQRQL
jgi:DNA-binding LacI/PurR family transcriptional regulator